MVNRLHGEHLAALLGWAFTARRENGRVDAHLVASELGVSEGTVRRWIRAGLPKARLEVLQELIEIPNDVLEEQRRQVEYSIGVARALRAGTIVAQKGWSDNQWMSPHAVKVVELTQVGHLCLAQINRVGAKKTDLPAKYGAVLLQSVVFPNRFVANAAKAEVLRAVNDWRVYVEEGVLDRGRTEAWVAGAAVPSLARLKRSLAARQIARHKDEASQV